MIKWPIGDFVLGIGVFRIGDFLNPENTITKFQNHQLVILSSTKSGKHQLVIKLPFGDFELGTAVFQNNQMVIK